MIYHKYKNKFRVYQSIIESCRAITTRMDMRHHITAWKMNVHTCENDPKRDMVNNLLGCSERNLGRPKYNRQIAGGGGVDGFDRIQTCFLISISLYHVI